MKDLPVDVLNNIVSYTHGEPEYVKIKNRQWSIEKIQDRYRIAQTETQREHRKFKLLSHTSLQE